MPRRSAAAAAEAEEGPEVLLCAPTWRTPHFMYAFCEKHGKPRPPAEQRGYPSGARLAQLESFGGGRTGLVARIEAFLPGGTVDDMSDERVDAYAVCFEDERGEMPGQEVLACWEVHDEGEWQRIDIPPKRNGEAGECARCGVRQRKTLRCGGCKAVRYCGRDCQRAAWHEHKPDCLRSKGAAVSSAVLEAAERAKAARLREEEARALAEVGEEEEVPPGSRGTTTLVLKGCALIDDLWQGGLEEFLDGGARKAVDISTADGARAAVHALRSGEARAAVVLGVGGGKDPRVLTENATLRGALVRFARAGGTVCLHGEGATLTSALKTWFDQLCWGGGRQSYCRMNHSCGVIRGVSTWGSAAQRDAVAAACSDACGDGMTVCPKAVMLAGVPPENRVLCVPADSESMGLAYSPPSESGTCCVAAGACGSGVVAYFGDVNAEPATCQIVAALCENACL